MSSDNLVEKAFKELFPDREFNYTASLEYSGRFSPYNANMQLRGKMLNLHFSKTWRDVGEEIQIGLVQSLLVKVFKGKNKTTTNMELYGIFMKKIHIAIPKTNSHPVLEGSFNRVNEKYFYGLIEKPNLVWGSLSLRKMGSYHYGSDTITISKILEDDQFLIDYVMYHELLHKKHKFHSVNGRSYHHTKDFRIKEKEYESQSEAEEKLKVLVSRFRRRRGFRGIFGF